MDSSRVEHFPGSYAPCRTVGPEHLDISGELIPSWIVLILIIIGVLILVWAEYKSHDCIPGKHCTHSAPVPSDNDSPTEYVGKIRDMVTNNYDFVAWRQALIVGLIVPLLLVLYLKGRLPTLIEVVIIGIVVFFIVYLSYSWIWAHFFHPNGRAIEKSLTELHDKIVQNCGFNNAL